MNPTKLALTLAITGVASAVLNAMNKPRQKADDTTAFLEIVCDGAYIPPGAIGTGVGVVSDLCGGAQAQDDIPASDVQSGQDDVPPPPIGDPVPTNFRSLPIYG